jgi:mRNA interferase MazF
MASKNIEIHPLQGDIWLFDPDPIKGNEIGKKVRPAVIISNDQWNKIRSGLVILVPMTSVYKGISTHIQIDPPDGGLVTACRNLYKSDTIYSNE